MDERVTISTQEADGRSRQAVDRFRTASTMYMPTAPAKIKTTKLTNCDSKRLDCTIRKMQTSTPMNRKTIVPRLVTTAARVCS